MDTYLVPSVGPRTRSTMEKKLDTVLFLMELVEWLGKKTSDKKKLQICVYSGL